MFKKFFAVSLVLVPCLFPATAPHRAFGAAEDGVVFEVGADLPVVQAGKGGQKIVLRALLRPSDGVRTRAPLAVALVLDKSGSMASDGKMENAKRGALEALKMLDPKDVASVVVYDDDVSVLVKARTVGRGAEDPAFFKAIRSVRAGGMTALYGGTTAGAKTLRPFVKEGYIPRIVMLSDGMANVGPGTAAELAALGRKLAREEVTVTTIGLGLDYDEDLMTALAAESGGNAYFARNGNILPEIFARDLGDAVTVTARKVTVTLGTRGGARVVRSVGREGTLTGDSLEVRVDNLYGGEKYVLFEIELPEGEDGTSLQAAEVEVEYVDAATGIKVSKGSSFAVAYSADLGAVEKNRRGDIQNQAELARNAEIREEVIRLADEGRAKEAAQMLRERRSQMAAMAPAPGMAKDEAAFDDMAESLATGGALSSTQRKKAMNDAYMQKNQQTAVSGDIEEGGDQ